MAGPPLGRILKSDGPPGAPQVVFPICVPVCSLRSWGGDGGGFQAPSVYRMFEDILSLRGFPRGVSIFKPKSAADFLLNIWRYAVCFVPLYQGSGIHQGDPGVSRDYPRGAQGVPRGDPRGDPAGPPRNPPRGIPRGTPRVII